MIRYNAREHGSAQLRARITKSPDYQITVTTAFPFAKVWCGVTCMHTHATPKVARLKLKVSTDWGAGGMRGRDNSLRDVSLPTTRCETTHCSDYSLATSRCSASSLRGIPLRDNSLKRQLFSQLKRKVEARSIISIIYIYMIRNVHN